MGGEPQPIVKEIFHTQLAQVTDSLRVNFAEDGVVGNSQNIESYRACREFCESTQNYYDAPTARSIADFMGKYFGKFGYGWREVQDNVIRAYKNRDKAANERHSYDYYAEQSKYAVTNEIEIPFYEMLNKNPVESLHFFQDSARELYEQVGEAGLRSGQDPEARKLLFFLEVVRDMQDSLADAPARKQQYLQGLRSTLAQQSTVSLSEASRQMLVERILPVLDTVIEKHRVKATMQGEQHVMNARQKGQMSRPIEELLSDS